VAGSGLHSVGQHILDVCNIVLARLPVTDVNDRYLTEWRTMPNAQAVPTLPVAPQHASRASNMTILNSFALSSSAKNLAADAPVIPEPTITMSASDGKSTVVRWPSRKSEGSLCQKEAVEFAVGRLAMLYLPILGYRLVDYSTSIPEYLHRDCKI